MHVTSTAGDAQLQYTYYIIALFSIQVIFFGGRKQVCSSTIFSKALYNFYYYNKPVSRQKNLDRLYLKKKKKKKPCSLEYLQLPVKCVPNKGGVKKRRKKKSKRDLLSFIGVSMIRIPESDGQYPYVHAHIGTDD